MEFGHASRIAVELSVFVAVTVYPVTGLEPSLEGSDQLTLTSEYPIDRAPKMGALGTVGATTGGEVAENVPVPAALIAATENV